MVLRRSVRIVPKQAGAFLNHQQTLPKAGGGIASAMHHLPLGLASALPRQGSAKRNFAGLYPAGYACYMAVSLAQPMPVMHPEAARPLGL